jgi:hypothetical protein
MELTVDVGKNITGLVEQLAQQLGVAADKVFPWYIQQAYLQGITEGVALIGALVFFGALFSIAIKRADFDDGNMWTPVCIVSGVAFVLALAMTFIAGPQQVRKVINPQFYAMQMLADDIGKIRGK